MNVPRSTRMKRETKLKTNDSSSVLFIYMFLYTLHFNHDHSQNFISISKVMFIRVDIDKFMSEIFRWPVTSQGKKKELA